MLSAIGRWGTALKTETHNDIIERVCANNDYCCQFCGFKTAKTESSPSGGLKVCSETKALSVDIDSCFALCDICSRFNSLDNLITPDADKEEYGRFVELPWVSQSDLTNTLRVLYCVQFLGEGDSQTAKTIKNLPIYKSSDAALNSLRRIPKEWYALSFEGKAETVKASATLFDGYNTNESNPYYDRLRFYFFPEKFRSRLEYWAPFIESELLG